MTDTRQIEMKVHKVKDQLGLIETKLNKIYDKVDILITQMDKCEADFKAIEEKLNDSKI